MIGLVGKKISGENGRGTQPSFTPSLEKQTQIQKQTWAIFNNFCFPPLMNFYLFGLSAAQS